MGTGIMKRWQLYFSCHTCMAALYGSIIRWQYPYICFFFNRSIFISHYSLLIPYFIPYWYLIYSYYSLGMRSDQSLLKDPLTHLLLLPLSRGTCRQMLGMFQRGRRGRKGGRLFRMTRTIGTGAWVGTISRGQQLSCHGTFRVSTDCTDIEASKYWTAVVM